MYPWDFIVNGNICWITFYWACQYRWSYISIGEHIGIPTEKHIDVCHHFIHDYVEDRSVKIEFVCSEENIAYKFTKNITNDIYGNDPFSITTKYW